MIFFEYWDKVKREWCLSYAKWYDYIIIRLIYWSNGGDPEISDIKRVKEKDIIIK